MSKERELLGRVLEGDHGGEKFAKAILQESHSIWHAMDNGNYVEGLIEMEDFPRAVLKRFKFK